MIRLFARRRSGATPITRSRPPASPTPAAARAPERAARRQVFAFSLKGYVAQHLQALFYSLGQMWRAPVATLMTAAVIGITLALPSVLYLVLEHAQQVSAGWGGGSQITLLLKQEVSDDAGRELAGRLRTWPAVAEAHAISRSEALEEFRQLSGFDAALEALGENPLPAVIALRLAADSAVDANAIREQLRMQPEVDRVEFEEQWLKRLQAIINVITRGVLLLAGLFAAAVLFIIGNTLRLAVQNRREEIEVVKLTGATDAFVRRPFLYSGLWYGALGGVCAWIMVNLALWMMGGPVQQLAGLYQSDFRLGGFGFNVTLALVVGGALLGLLGAGLSVGRHLARIEPS